tara:strand:+ start:34 stop:585 length:552 start_codon:yes stop_codon:yes gene_type:complete
MKSSRAAIRYARALILESSEKDTLDQTHDDMLLLKETFDQNIDLKHMIESLVIKNSIKLSSLRLIFKNLGQISLNLIDVLSENNRIDIIDLVAEKYIVQYKVIKGIQSATLTTAVPVNKKIEVEFLKKIAELTDKKTTLIKKVDESLIGGFVLRIGDLQYNASYKNKLKNIKQEFNKNTNALT